MVNELLQRARIAKGLSVRDICRKTGFHEKTYRRIEAGTHIPHRSTLDDLCILFRMTPAELGFSFADKKEAAVHNRQEAPGRDEKAEHVEPAAQTQDTHLVDLHQSVLSSAEV
ncbi:MAG: helix-turn-helix transcriptional regulator, partial [Chloroflexi bacterium]|nr:helix-turn-helix transcriptional regulator [Chloroflexota bacterium]